MRSDGQVNSTLRFRIPVNLSVFMLVFQQESKEPKQSFIFEALHEMFEKMKSSVERH